MARAYASPQAKEFHEVVNRMKQTAPQLDPRLLGWCRDLGGVVVGVMPQVSTSAHLAGTRNRFELIALGSPG